MRLLRAISSHYALPVSSVASHNPLLPHPLLSRLSTSSSLSVGAVDTVFPMFKLWTLALRSASMSFKLMAFNILARIINNCRTAISSLGSHGVIRSDNDNDDDNDGDGAESSHTEGDSDSDNDIRAASLKVLETCLSVLPVERMRASAAKRLWHEMEDFPSYSRYIQVRTRISPLHSLSYPTLPYPILSSPSINSPQIYLLWNFSSNKSKSLCCNSPITCTAAHRISSLSIFDALNLFQLPLLYISGASTLAERSG